MYGRVRSSSYREPRELKSKIKVSLCRPKIYHYLFKNTYLNKNQQENEWSAILKIYAVYMIITNISVALSNCVEIKYTCHCIIFIINNFKEQVILSDF